MLMVTCGCVSRVPFPGCCCVSVVGLGSARLQAVLAVAVLWFGCECCGPQWGVRPALPCSAILTGNSERLGREMGVAFSVLRAGFRNLKSTPVGGMPLSPAGQPSPGFPEGTLPTYLGTAALRDVSASFPCSHLEAWGSGGPCLVQSPVCRAGRPCAHVHQGLF